MTTLFSLEENGRMYLTVQTPLFDIDGNEKGMTNHKSVHDPLDHNYTELMADAVALILPSIALDQEKTIQAHEAQKITDDETIASERGKKDAKAAECTAHETTIARLEAEIAELKGQP